MAVNVGGIHVVDNQRSTDVLCGGGMVNYSGMLLNIHDVRVCHQAICWLSKLKKMSDHAWTGSTTPNCWSHNGMFPPASKMMNKQCWLAKWICTSHNYFHCSCENSCSCTQPDLHWIHHFVREILALNKAFWSYMRSCERSMVLNL